MHVGMPGGVVDWIGAGIAGIYLFTNAARVFSYVPQILALRRCRDGARVMSLLTWSYWLLSHATALAYGVLVLGDVFFVVVTVLNLAGCATVTCMIARRRGLLRREVPAAVPTPAGDRQAPNRCAMAESMSGTGVPAIIGFGAVRSWTCDQSWKLNDAPAVNPRATASSAYTLYPLTPFTSRVTESSTCPSTSQAQSTASPHWCHENPGGAWVTGGPFWGPTELRQ